MSVDFSVTMVAQAAPHSCWAAATATLLNYNGFNHDDWAVVQDLQERFPNQVWDDAGVPIELGQVAYHYGLNQLRPSGVTPDALEELLKSAGPILVGLPANSHHAYLISGVSITEGIDPNDAVRIHIVDPEDGDRWMPIQEFRYKYEPDRSDFADNIYRY
jgi:hypothetical protein